LIKHQIILSSAHLGARVGPILDLTICVNLLFNLPIVFSWGIVLNTRATSVLILLSVVCMCHVMLYFDETVFHFASLHPNAGAQLKAEILLLHPTLRNAQGEGCVDAPNMSNSANSAPESYAETCTHHGSSNNVENEEAEMPTDPVAVDNLGARSSVDATPDAAAESSSGADGAGIGSSLGSAPTVVSGNLFVPPGPIFSVLQILQQPTIAGDSGVAATEDLVLSTGTHDAMQSGSSMPSSSAAVPEGDRLKTRLQNNVRKPKVYTDGTIRYAYLTTAGESKSVSEALDHEQWRNTMDEEYQALERNKTWHLMSSRHATNVIDYK
jgi:hypothetical protein